MVPTMARHNEAQHPRDRTGRFRHKPRPATNPTLTRAAADAEHQPTRPRSRDRYYRNNRGDRPVAEYLDTLPDSDRLAVKERMNRLRRWNGTGTPPADMSPVRSGVMELRVPGDKQSHRVLFSREGGSGQVTLWLHAFSKKDSRIPWEDVRLAESRLADWRTN